MTSVVASELIEKTITRQKQLHFLKPFFHKTRFENPDESKTNRNPICFCLRTNRKNENNVKTYALAKTLFSIKPGLKTRANRQSTEIKLFLPPN